MEGNGYYKDPWSKLEKIDSGVEEIKTELSKSIDGLALAVTNLSNKFDLWMNIAANQVPLKAVFWMFFIVVLSMVGVEGVKYLASLHP